MAFDPSIGVPVLRRTPRVLQAMLSDLPPDWTDATEGPHDLLGEFARLRAENLATLLATWVAHDLNHIAQIVRVMAKQYREAVGPWQVYLSIMDR